MQLAQPNSKSSVRGVALILTLVIVGVMLTVFASIYYWANSNATVTQRNNQYNMSQNAAESAVEMIVGQMDRDFENGGISNVATMYNGLPINIDQGSWPIRYTYSSTNGSTGMVDVVFAPLSNAVVPLNSEYAGLNGQAQDVDIWATATPAGQLYNVPATVHESMEFADIPLFQFAIFYNVNLEIMSAAALNIYGPVFCNMNIWEGSNLAVFYSSVTAHGTNAAQVADPFAWNYSGSGASTFMLSGQPVNNANSIVMPIGTNNSPGAVISMLELPPTAYAMGTAGGYSSNGMVYPANAADLVVSNSATGTNYYGAYQPVGTNLTVYFQDFALNQLTYDFYLITNANLHISYVTNYISPVLLGHNTNIFFAGFSWATNVAFYDWREGWNGGSGPAKQVQAVQIDMGLLNKWLTNNLNSSANYGYQSDQSKLSHSGHHIGSVYVYNSVPLSSSVMPAVRMVNGAQLPSPGGSTFGFTVATQFPIYVWGDYNSQNNGHSALGQYGTNGATANTLPAALMGDAVTILSDNWSDGNSKTKTTGGPTAADTTVNAAMLEGIVPTNPNINGNYSGGVENFLRLLENWGTSNPLTYNGSIDVLFYSQYATNSWQQTGNYYTAPTRHWAFDLNYQTPSKLPPLTPNLRAMIRGNWYAHQ